MEYISRHNPNTKLFRSPERTEDMPTRKLISLYIQCASYYSKGYRESAVKYIQERLLTEMIMTKKDLG